MEQVIQFLESYWGVSVVGGITVGGIITFAVVQIGVLRKDKKKNALIDASLAVAEAAIARNHEEELKNAQLLAQNEYMQKVIALTFKSVSYLTAGSKLPTADKLELQEDFVLLKDESRILVEKLLMDVVVDLAEGDTIQEALKENASEAVNIALDVAEKAVGLMDKYTKEG
jgi:hypothetical protein